MKTMEHIVMAIVNYIITRIMTWKEVLKVEQEKPYWESLVGLLRQEQKAYEIYPPNPQVLNAFKLTSLSNVKVLIMGQDPYHGPNQAHGLAFSVQKGVKIPPSLKNIYKELASDVGFTIPDHGNLTEWAEQGVLLLNSTLTVRKGEPNSHEGIGWGTLTDNVIKAVSEHQDNVIFILWGAFAQGKEKLIDKNKHSILRAPHPSPFSANRGFFGCKHFSKTYAILEQRGKEPIDWQL